MFFAGKILGALIGFFFGGPIGAFIGYFLGEAIIDNSVNQYRFFQYIKYQVFLAGQLVALDGQVSPGKKEFVLSVIDEIVEKVSGDEERKSKRKTLQSAFFEGIEHCDKYEETAMAMANFLYKIKAEDSLRKQIIQFLIGVSVADGFFHQEAGRFLRKVTLISGVSESWLNAELQRVVNDYDPDSESETEDTHFYSDEGDNAFDEYFRELNLDPGSSVEEIKKAYRKLVKEFHPDRYHAAAVPDSLRKLAVEKFIRVKKAYQVLMDQYVKS